MSMKDNQWTVAIVVGLGLLVVTIVAEILRENRKADLPLEKQAVRVKPNETDFDVVNPATRPRRIHEAWFIVSKPEPPSQNGYECCASIDKVDITFVAANFSPKHNAYYKQLGEVEIRAQEEGIFRVKIVDPSRVGWKYYGRLIVGYGDNKTPKYDTWENYYITVSDVEKPASSPAVSQPPKANSLHLIPNGTAPDGRRPTRHGFNKLPVSPSYQRPVEVR
jgi:hypothetical protein